jgi:hypothetical protein
MTLGSQEPTSNFEVIPLPSPEDEEPLPQAEDKELEAQQAQDDMLPVLQNNRPPRPEVLVQPDPFLEWTATKPHSSGDRILLAKDTM